MKRRFTALRRLHGRARAYAFQIGGERLKPLLEMLHSFDRWLKARPLHGAEADNNDNAAAGSKP